MARLTTNYAEDEEERRRRELELGAMERFVRPQTSVSLDDFIVPEGGPRSSVGLEPPDPEIERMHRSAMADDIPRTAMTPADYEQDALRAVRDSYQREAARGGGFWPNLLTGGQAGRAKEDAIRQVAQMQIALADSQNRQVRGQREAELRERGFALDEQAMGLREQEIANERARIAAAGQPDSLEQQYKQAQIDQMRANTARIMRPEPAMTPELAYRMQRDQVDDQRYAEDQARRQAEEQRKQAVAAQEAAETERLRTPFEGTTITNQALWDAGASDKVTRRRMAEGVAAYQSAIRALGRMQEIRAQYGTEITRSAATGEYKTLSNELLAAVGTAANAGVLQPSDITRFQEQVPELSPQWSDMMRVFGRDPTLESLQGTGTALRGSADTKSRTYGFSYDYNNPVFQTDAALQAAGRTRPAPPPGQNPMASPKVQQLYQQGPPQGDESFQSGPVTPGAYWRPGQGQPMQPPAAGDVLPVTNQRPRDVPRVDEYLRRLSDEDDDLGVRYR